MSTPLPQASRQALGEALGHHLEQARRWRAARSGAAAPATEVADHDALRRWQAGRLAQTYADLLSDTRHAPAARFFLTELYGPQDFSGRDAELERALPKLLTTLPTRALATLVDAVSMDALSEALDREMVLQLRAAGRAQSIDEAAYAAAYRACGRLEDRRRQIELVQHIGQTLDRLTHVPLLATTLRLMRHPAEKAGFGQMQHFLQTGFEAFRHMQGAEHFLATVQQRETALMQRWSAPAVDGTAAAPAPGQSATWPTPTCCSCPPAG